MIIYSEQEKIIGTTRQSPCGCMTQIIIYGEPWRTLLTNILIDYALVAPFEPNVYRLDYDETNQRWLVKAKSAIETSLLVDIAEVSENEQGHPILSLLRIRPQYSGRRKRARDKQNIN